MVQGPATTILGIYLFFHQNGVTFLCVRLWAGPRVFLSLPFVDGQVLVTLEGEFCGSSFNILEIEGDIKCTFALFYNEEQV